MWNELLYHFLGIYQLCSYCDGNFGQLAVGMFVADGWKCDQWMLSIVSEEISRQLRDCQPKAIVTLSAILRTVQEAIKLTGTQAKPLIVIAPGVESAPDIPAGTVDLRHMLQDGVDISDVRFTGNIDDTAVLPYSSGTTGLPKGVMLSHRNIVSNIAQMNDCHEICPIEPALSMTVLFIQAVSPDITGLPVRYNNGKTAIFLSFVNESVCREWGVSAWRAEWGANTYSVQSVLQREKERPYSKYIMLNSCIYCTARLSVLCCLLFLAVTKMMNCTSCSVEHHHM